MLPVERATVRHEKRGFGLLLFFYEKFELSLGCLLYFTANPSSITNT
jgi:hypothetical protein